MSVPQYKRVVIKLSGEALAGEAGFGLSPKIIKSVAEEVKEVVDLDVEVAVVVGGGNIWRGKIGSEMGMDRAAADYMGMLATVMNSLVLEAAIVRMGGVASTLSAIPMPTICDHFSRRRALDLIAAGQVVILAGGTGNPFFTTDTTAVLRAAELDCKAVLKATNVDGVYNADPKRDPDAVRYDRLTPGEAISKNLKVMDTAAFALARENAMPIIVFSIREPGAIASVLRGQGRATIVSE